MIFFSDHLRVPYLYSYAFYLLIFSGQADEMAFAEECRRRGQNALPSSSRTARTHHPPAVSRHIHGYRNEEEGQQEILRDIYGETLLHSAGVQKQHNEEFNDGNVHISQSSKCTTLPEKKQKSCCCCIVM